MYLLDVNVHEQAISHRIAVYLEQLMPDFHVDCEYNKHLGNDKLMAHVKEFINKIPTEELQSCGCDTCKKIKELRKDGKDLEKKKIRPDIIVHTRNIDSNNLMVIEVKKDRNCPFDKAKLESLTSTYDYKYSLGVFVIFKNHTCKLVYFVNGEKVDAEDFIYKSSA